MASPVFELVYGKSEHCDGFGCGSSQLPRVEGCCAYVMAEFFDIVIVGGYCRRFVYVLPTDRAAFDVEVLRRRAELLRPGAVTTVELSPGGEQASRVAIVRPSKRFAHAGSSMPRASLHCSGRKEG